MVDLGSVANYLLKQRGTPGEGLGKCLGLGRGGSSRLAVGRSAGQGLAKANNQRPVGGKGIGFSVLPEAEAEGDGAVCCLLSTPWSTPKKRPSAQRSKKQVSG